MSSFDLKAIITAEDKASAVFGRVGGNITNSMADAGRQIAKYSAILAATGAASVGFAVKSAADIQMIRTNLDTLTGSAENGKKVFSDLYNFAAKTPFEIGDLANASQTLLSFGISTDKLMPSLKMIGDISLGNKEKFSGLALAFSQVQSTGRLMGQDLLQMVNQGFNPLTIISEKTGKSMAILKDEMEKGKISADMVSDAFKIATSEGGRFYNGMDKGAQTFNGTLSTLKDTIGMAARSMVGLSETGDVVKGGLFDKVSQSIVNMTSWIEQNKQKIIEVATTIITVLGSALSWMWNALVTTIQFLNEHKQLAVALAVAIGAFAAAALIAAGVVFVMANAMVIAIGLIVGAVAALTALIIMNWDKIKQWTIDTFNGIINFFSTLPEKMAYWAGEAIGWYIAQWYLLPGRIKDAMASLYETLKKAWEWIKNDSIGWAKGVIDSIVDFFIGLPQRIADGIGNAASKIGGVVKNFFAGASKGFNIAIEGKAIGGAVSGNTPYIVGERGPELFVPNSSGTIVPNNQISNKNVTINNYNTFTRSSDPMAFARELGFQLSR